MPCRYGAPCGLPPTTAFRCPSSSACLPPSPSHRYPSTLPRLCPGQQWFSAHAPPRFYSARAGCHGRPIEHSDVLPALPVHWLHQLGRGPELSSARACDATFRRSQRQECLSWRGTGGHRALRAASSILTWTASNAPLTARQTPPRCPGPQTCSFSRDLCARSSSMRRRPRHQGECVPAAQVVGVTTTFINLYDEPDGAAAKVPDVLSEDFVQVRDAVFPPPFIRPPLPLRANPARRPRLPAAGVTSLLRLVYARLPLPADKHRRHCATQYV